MLCWIIVFLWFWLLIYYVQQYQYVQKEYEQLSISRHLAEQRLINNVKPNGWFVYRYDPVTDHSADSNNELRQLMATRLLGELVREDSSLYQLHRKNLDYIMSRYFKSSGDVAWIEYAGKSKLWAIAMAIRAFLASPFADEYLLQTIQLGNTVLSLQNNDWSFRAWRIAPSYAYDEDYLLTFYSWEAIVALMELYNRTGDARRFDAARRAADFYLIRYVQQIDQRYYPAYVPWHTIGYWYLRHVTQDDRYADAIYFLNDTLVDEMLYTGSTDAYKGRFYNPALPQYGSPHSSSDAVYTEWLAYAYALARQQGDTTHEQKYLDALVLATKNLMRLQYSSETIWSWQVTAKVLGAIRTNYEDPKIRVDTTQHMIDAFSAIALFTK